MPRDSRNTVLQCCGGMKVRGPCARQQDCTIYLKGSLRLTPPTWCCPTATPSHCDRPQFWSTKTRIHNGAMFLIVQ